MIFLRTILTALAILGSLTAATFDFAILGDRTGGAVPGVYEKVCKEIGEHHPSFVINVGDTIQGMDDVTTLDEWNAVRPVWKSFGDIPFYLVPGNHDIWSPASIRIWRQQTGHPPHYSFDFKGAHFTVLDNSRENELPPEQLEFLAADLAANAARQPKFIFFHRPFWLLPVKFQYSDFELHQLAKKYGVAFVVSGHAHEFDRSEFQGIQYVMVGSSGGSLDHGSESSNQPARSGRYFGYAWVHVDGAAAKLEFRRVAAQRGEGK